MGFNIGRIFSTKVLLRDPCPGLTRAHIVLARASDVTSMGFPRSYSFKSHESLEAPHIEAIHRLVVVQVGSVVHAPPIRLL